uniref:Uncharacterized protein n=1 Tax=Percolomonas cosmopolitus TaxID=63605 RepID=A0A7S1PGL2_9EUKA|eukprot:CAMPEP_0117444954 /NCGR_PEP_ID=MMETSP0759-20121206/5530_1 /TAXON_ID=63605 /ORGANISM="Percolomonas cosmopolitus, Strain WS" /LENGTH=784 /DNA_ID=CAMNT_0005237083 /DNA_START=70 /DNA_END=2424 /DNA_ORIENTATION=+
MSSPNNHRLTSPTTPNTSSDSSQHSSHHQNAKIREFYSFLSSMTPKVRKSARFMKELDGGESAADGGEDRHFLASEGSASVDGRGGGAATVTAARKYAASSRRTTTTNGTPVFTPSSSTHSSSRTYHSSSSTGANDSVTVHQHSPLSKQHIHHPSNTSTDNISPLISRSSRSNNTTFNSSSHSFVGGPQQESSFNLSIQNHSSITQDDSMHEVEFDKSMEETAVRTTVQEYQQQHNTTNATPTQVSELYTEVKGKMDKLRTRADKRQSKIMSLMNQVSKLRRREGELKLELADTTQDHMGQIKELQMELTDTKEQLELMQQNLTQHEEETVTRIAAMRRQMDQEIDERMDEEKEEWDRNTHQQVAAQEEQFHRQLRELKAEHKKDLEEVENLLHDERMAHEDALQTMENEKQNAIQDTIQKYTLQIDDLRGEIRSKSKQYHRELSEQLAEERAKWQLEREELEADHKHKLEKSLSQERELLTKQFDRDLNDKISELIAEMQQKMEATQHDIEQHHVEEMRSKERQNSQWLAQVQANCDQQIEKLTEKLRTSEDAIMQQKSEFSKEKASILRSNDSLKKENESLYKRIMQYEARIDSQNAEIEQLESDLDSVENSTQNATQKLQQERDSLLTKIKSYESNLKELQIEVDTLHQDYATQIDAYQAKRDSEANQLMNASKKLIIQKDHTIQELNAQLKQYESLLSETDSLLRKQREDLLSDDEDDTTTMGDDESDSGANATRDTGANRRVSFSSTVHKMGGSANRRQSSGRARLDSSTDEDDEQEEF